LAELSEDRVEEKIHPVVITTADIDTEVKADGKKNSDEGQNWRKVKEGVPIKHVPYPHAPSRREVECQFIRFT